MRSSQYRPGLVMNDLATVYLLALLSSGRLSAAATSALPHRVKSFERGEKQSVVEYQTAEQANRKAIEWVKIMGTTEMTLVGKEE
jgi:hypothetical protein